MTRKRPYARRLRRGLSLLLPAALLTLCCVGSAPMSVQPASYPEAAAVTAVEATTVLAAAVPSDADPAFHLTPPSPDPDPGVHQTPPAEHTDSGFLAGPYPDTEAVEIPVG